MDDKGAPIAYMVLAEGTPVFSSEGVKLGEVKRVLADEERKKAGLAPGEGKGVEGK